MIHLRNTGIGPYEIANKCGINAIKMTDWLCEGSPLDKSEMTKIKNYFDLK